MLSVFKVTDCSAVNLKAEIHHEVEFVSHSFELVSQHFFAHQELSEIKARLIFCGFKNEVYGATVCGFAVLKVLLRMVSTEDCWHLRSLR